MVGILIGLIIAFVGYQLFVHGWELIMQGWAEWTGTRRK